MNTAEKIILGFCAAFCLIASVIGACLDKGGWGWFLAVGVLDAAIWGWASTHRSEIANDEWPPELRK